MLLMLTTRLIHAVRLHPDRQWRLAHRAGLHPSTLSRWVNYVEMPRPDDVRLIKLAKLVDVPLGECFTEDSSATSGTPPIENAPETQPTFCRELREARR